LEQNFASGKIVTFEATLKSLQKQSREFHAIARLGGAVERKYKIGSLFY
jgi:hypothetical protein